MDHFLSFSGFVFSGWTLGLLLEEVQREGPQVGCQPRRAAWLSSGEEPWWGGDRERGCVGHGSPRHRKGEAVKPPMPNEFRFSLL